MSSSQPTLVGDSDTCGILHVGLIVEHNASINCPGSERTGGERVGQLVVPWQGLARHWPRHINRPDPRASGSEVGLGDSWAARHHGPSGRIRRARQCNCRGSGTGGQKGRSGRNEYLEGLILTDPQVPCILHVQHVRAVSSSGQNLTVGKEVEAVEQHLVCPIGPIGPVEGAGLDDPRLVVENSIHDPYRYTPKGKDRLALHQCLAL